MSDFFATKILSGLICSFLRRFRWSCSLRSSESMFLYGIVCWSQSWHWFCPARILCALPSLVCRHPRQLWSRSSYSTLVRRLNRQFVSLFCKVWITCWVRGRVRSLQHAVCAKPARPWVQNGFKSGLQQDDSLNFNQSRLGPPWGSSEERDHAAAKEFQSCKEWARGHPKSG